MRYTLLAILLLVAPRGAVALTWDFADGTTWGWTAREGTYSNGGGKESLRSEIVDGVWRIAPVPNRRPTVELRSPLIGKDSALFDRLTLRLRLIHHSPTEESFRIVWSNAESRRLLRGGFSTGHQQPDPIGYSVRIVHNQDIGPTERVKRLGRRFGFITSIEERHTIRTRWVFTQDGSEFPLSMEEPQSGGYRISGDNVQGMGYLRDAIRNILTNAALNDYDQDLDEIELQWDGAAADNPFEHQVDIAVDLSDGWDAALDYLREHFGVTMERISEPITYEVLVLKGAK